MQEASQRESEKPHRKLIVWEKGMELVQTIYALTNSFPVSERFSLVSQMRRSSISIPSNIAERAARFSNKEKLNFFHIARGSLSELDTQIEISFRLQYMSQEQQRILQNLIDDVGRLLHGLILSRKERTLYV